MGTSDRDRQTTPRNVQDAIHLHTGRCSAFLGDAMARALFNKPLFGLSPEMQTALILAGANAAESIKESGWDLVFRDNGSLIEVVTDDG